MVHDSKLVESLEALSPTPWEGEVFRHMFRDYLPERENVLGARWNPPDVPAIYTSLGRDVALAEAEYHINAQPLRPSAERRIYRIAVHLSRVLDLRDKTVLQALGVDPESFAGDHAHDCQRVGGAVEWLGHDGCLVPSARAEGANLVIFPNQQTAAYMFKVLDVALVD